MACSKCKKKKNYALTAEERENNSSKTINIDKLQLIVNIFLIIWSAFAIYGIISFINLFL